MLIPPTSTSPGLGLGAPSGRRGQGVLLTHDTRQLKAVPAEQDSHLSAMPSSIQVPLPAETSPTGQEAAPLRPQDTEVIPRAPECPGLAAGPAFTSCQDSHLFRSPVLLQDGPRPSYLPWQGFGSCHLTCCLEASV